MEKPFGFVKDVVLKTRRKRQLLPPTSVPPPLRLILPQPRLRQELLLSMYRHQ
jgi:hypothetical protein